MPESRSCFVIMPIGDLEFDGQHISSDDLKKRYDDLIKEAVMKAIPGLEVVRADEISLPGTITSDILTRIMHSDFVIADVTFPNPNVFYELGLRHACRPGTIIIKDKNGPSVPFDIAHLRHIEYDNSPTGLKKLASEFKFYFEHFERSPDRPDNHLLELAKLTGYEFQNYRKNEITEEDAQIEAFMSLMKSPATMDLLMRKGSGEVVDEKEMIGALMSNPDAASTFLKAMLKSGEISLVGSHPKKQIPHKKSTRRKKR